MSDATHDHGRQVAPWAAHAANWARIGSPLRPCPEDLQRLHAAWLDSLPDGPPARPLDILLLGVTPELALFPWAKEQRLTAVDASAQMLRSVWPGDAPGRTAILARWDAVPFADASFDLIVCDNGLAVLPDIAGLTAVAGELRRVLRRVGRVVMRHLAPAAKTDTEQSLVAATAAGAVENFHGLKLRLLLLLAARAPGQGVRLAEAWDCFARLFPDRDALARQLRCERETVDTIDTYRASEGRYIFHSLAELARIFEAFALRAGPAGHYPFAEYCPVFSLTPRG